MTSETPPSSTSASTSASASTSTSATDTRHAHIKLIPSSPLSPQPTATADQTTTNSLAHTSNLPPHLSDMHTTPSTSADTATPVAGIVSSIDPLVSAHQLLNGERKMRILVLSSDTGGGHRASAQALQSAFESLYPTLVHVDIVDFWVDLAEGMFAKFPEQYTYMAKHPWMWKMSYELTRFPPFRAMTESLMNTLAHRNIRAAFAKYAPDLILSVHPLVNTLSQKVLRTTARRTGIPQTPYVTVITDMGGAHPTWFTKACDMTYVPTDAIKDIGIRVGVASHKMRLFGLPVRPDFWQPATSDKQRMREQLGLNADQPAILAIGGGDGVGGLKSIATKLARDLPKRLRHANVQLVIICGKNDTLRDWLCNQTWSISVTALGYVTNMSDWMAACDILCTKAGPGTIAEGLIRGLPMVITGFLPGQEEGNVKLVVQEGVGAYAKKPERVVSLVASWLAEPDRLQDMSARAQRMGRPQATVDIARDIFEVAKGRIEDNASVIENQRRVRQCHEEFADSGLSAFIPHRRLLVDSDMQSHLWFRMRFLFRIVFATMIAHRAVHYDGRTAGSPPSPPLDVITDGRRRNDGDDNEDTPLLLPQT